MFRFVLSAVALVGLLAAAHPVFADPVPATASDHAQAAAAAMQQPASPAPARVTVIECDGAGWISAGARWHQTQSQ